MTRRATPPDGDPSEPRSAGARWLRFAPYLVVLASLAALPIVTSERTALPAPLALGAALAALLVVALWRSGPPRAALDAPLAAAIGLASGVAFLVPGQVIGHDTLNHLWGAWAYLQAWHQGDLFPLWLHHLGLGMPLPLFYGPLPFWAMAPAALAGAGPAVMLATSFVLSSVFAALAAWAAVATWSGDRRAALVAATAWAYSPYRLLDVNFRIALGESWSLALLPLALLVFDRLIVTRSRCWFLAATGVTALLVLAHPLSLVLLAALLPVLGLLRLAEVRQEGFSTLLRRVGLAVGAGLAGIALAGFFALPLLAEKRFVDLDYTTRDTSGTSRFSRRGLRPEQLVERELWHRLAWSQPQSTAREGLPEMPHYFGLALLAALGGAALAGARGRARAGSPLPALAAFGATGIACSLGAVARWLEVVPGVLVVQFPWRFVGPASAAAALALGLLAARARDDLPKLARPIAIALALAALVDGFPYSGAALRAAPWRGLVVPDPVDAIHGFGVLATREVPRPWPLRLFGIYLPPWRCCAEVGELHNSYREYFTPLSRPTSMRLVEASVGIALYTDGRLEPVDGYPYARLWRRRGEAPRVLAFRRGGGAIEVELPHRARGRIEVAEQYFPGWQTDASGSWREVVPSELGLLSVEAPRRRDRVRFRFHRWRWDRAAGWLLSLVTALVLAGIARRAGRASRAPTG